MSTLPLYGTTEGPLGFPMQDADAKALDELIRTLPEQDYQRVVVEKAMTELSQGERADVSWICTESIDRQREIVLTSGFRDDHFKNNPIVTLNHDYTKQPVGKSLWRKKVRDGAFRGIKAKTVYPPRPDDWPGDQAWAPDVAFALVKAGLMTGKSIGFLTLRAHSPTDDEVRKAPELQGVRRIVDEWMLLEYCCTWLPVNQDAVTEAVSKSLVTPEALQFVGVELPPPAPAPIVPITSMDEIERRIQKGFARLDTATLVDRLWKEGWERAKGRV